MEVHTCHKLTPANLYESFPDSVVFFLHTHAHTHSLTYAHLSPIFCVNPALILSLWSSQVFTRLPVIWIWSSKQGFEIMNDNWNISTHPPTSVGDRQIFEFLSVHCYSLYERNSCSYLSLLSYLQGESEIIDLMSFCSKQNVWFFKNCELKISSVTYLAVLTYEVVQ